METSSPQVSNKENEFHPKSSEQNVLDELAPKVSIQDAFKKFQKEKFYQLKLNRFLKNVKVDRSTQEFKQQLRDKFIETSKKYMGVPYAQKYHQPGDELYSAPLFLDCCALIRQVVFDLRQDFGYTLAKWNQSYQFDLLPDEGLDENSAKPGDLIFYSATYSNPKLKPFPHSMVHVEIYLGEGKSIGSRWQKGVIQIFDSYKFNSTLYHSVKHHFRSLDSWLEGKFESHCAEHKWKDERNGEWLSEKFSVFADPALDDMEITKNEGKNECRKIMVGKGNNSKLVKNFFNNKNDENEKNGSGVSYVLMEEKDQFSPHYFYKWVQSPGEVDFYSFKENEQIVNHIPNILCVLAHKLELLKTLQEFETDCEAKGYSLTLKTDEFIPKTFRLDVMSDEISFINHKSDGIWIYKPRNLNQGRGIKMISDINQFKKEFIQSKKFYLGQYSFNNMIEHKPELMEQIEAEAEESRYKDLKHDGLIQQYIRPLLLGGRKFDIRCYMFVNTEPNIVFFHSGYLRLTIEKYDEEDIESEEKLMVHLTNNSYQHKHKLYKEQKEQSIANWDLIKNEIGEAKAEELLHQMKRILVLTFAAAKNKLMKKKGTYELLGCDFLVSNDLKPYLLEINTNPAMFTDTKTQTEIIPPLLNSTLELVLGLNDDNEYKFLEEIENQPQKYGFELLFSQHSKLVYGSHLEKDRIVSKDDQFFLNGLPLAQ